MEKLERLFLLQSVEDIEANLLSSVFRHLKAYLALQLLPTVFTSFTVVSATWTAELYNLAVHPTVREYIYTYLLISVNRLN